MRQRQPKTWVEVSASALAHNLKALQDRVGGSVAVMAVIKSDAYGHGLDLVARVAKAAGVGWFGVDSIDEAIRLRKAVTKGNILILGYTPLSRLPEAASLGARVTVYGLDALRALAKTGRTARVHIKLETGTTRQGVGEKDLRRLVAYARRTRKITIEGLSTHYANIEDTTDHRYAAKQLKGFIRLSKIAERVYGRPIPVKHTACSAAALLFPETHFNLARIGITLYGLWPSRETRLSARERRIKLELEPALSWKTLVAQVKDVRAGTPVSYGLTAKVTRRSRVAVLPVGYFDGLDRGLSSAASVLIRGRRAPIIGRICMNMCMADVTDIPGVRSEDEVVLLGSQGQERITAEEVASALGTINYEVVTRINPLLPRILVK